MAFTDRIYWLESLNKKLYRVIGAWLGELWKKWCRFVSGETLVEELLNRVGVPLLNVQLIHHIVLVVEELQNGRDASHKLDLQIGKLL